MQDQAQEQEEEVKATFEGGEEPDSAPPRSDLESADSDDVAEQSASVEVTEATLERRQTKAISESAGQPNEESAD